MRASHESRQLLEQLAGHGLALGSGLGACRQPIPDLARDTNAGDLVVQVVGVLRLAELELDIIKRKVVREGRDIALTPKEFSLLEFLLENAGHPVSRSMIIEKIWGYGFGAHDNVIDVHMNRLRNKVDKEFTTPLIRTIRGVGYTIEAPNTPSSA